MTTLWTACPSNPEPTPDLALDQAMATMHSVMAKVQCSGNPDADFAQMMIPHHQGAIDMAKVELQFGKDLRLRRLAQEIIVTQQSEIDVMRAALYAYDRSPANPKRNSWCTQ
ncbi:MAG: DUF305 domain-containing protein [Verrucomicrobia bacterium]|nr:DUF305 domain-containing protein [Verrucomicrobiota bacterium]MBV9673119.1 DUF305 domain-containing protein [Verrucomicrobiota bacterium]